RPAPEPSRLPLAAAPKAPLVPPNAEPQKSELAPLGIGAPEEGSGDNALSLPDDRDTPARYDEEDSGLSPLADALDYPGYRPEHRRLVGRVAVLGAVLLVAAGLPYVLMRSEKPLAAPPMAANASAATIGSNGAGGQKKLIQDRLVGAVSADET